MRMPSFFAPRTCFMAGCASGAKQNRGRLVEAGFNLRGRRIDVHAQLGQHIRRPLRLVMLRLPCLATGTPAAAATIAAVVLTLNILESPPPVPHVSSTSAWRADGRHMPPHHMGRPGDLIDVSPLRPNCQEQTDLFVGPLAAHDGIEGSSHSSKERVLPPAMWPRG